MEPDNQVNNADPAHMDLRTQVPAPKSGSGALVGTVIIILLLAAGALYLWSARPSPADNPPPLILGNDAAADSSSDSDAGLPPQGNSDSPEAINSDLEMMNFTQFDSQTDASLNEFERNAQ